MPDMLHQGLSRSVPIAFVNSGLAEERERLTNEPSRPDAAPVMSRTGATSPARHALFSIARPSTATRPIKSPPSSDTSVPHAVTPPFVPRGTFRQDVMSTGSAVDRIPSSLANFHDSRHIQRACPSDVRSSVRTVSPAQAAKNDTAVKMNSRLGSWRASRTHHLACDHE